MSTELGLRIAPDWADGVWMVELAGITTDMPIAATVAEALGVSIAGRNPMEAVVDGLSGKSAVLILDNCEHVIEEVADFVTDLLRRIPTVGLLATSREPLSIGHERVWRIDPLHADSEANALFVDRAQAAGLRGDLTEEDWEVVERICRRLDGIPLALELAAARVAAVSAPEIVSRLDDRFRLLRTGSRSGVPHHQTLRVLIDWSYDLLPPEERALLARLSIFSGGWTLESAGAVCSSADLDAAGVFDGCLSLVSKSLVELDTDLTRAKILDSYLDTIWEETERRKAEEEAEAEDEESEEGEDGEGDEEGGFSLSDLEKLMSQFGNENEEILKVAVDTAFQGVDLNELETAFHEFIASGFSD